MMTGGASIAGRRCMADLARREGAGGGGELRPRLDDLRAFGRIVWRRFGEDKCLRVAASLSYTSLLALVPLVAVGFAVLSAFPVFETVQKDIQAFVFDNFLPSAVDEAQAYIDQFVGKARELTGPGIIGLALTAMLLLSTIETAMNAIFRVTRPRPLVPRVLVFWAVLTLGPLLLGASFSLSTYMVALTASAEIEAFTGPLGRLARLLPLVLAVAGFTVFFTIIPNRPVKIRHALAGGVVAGVLLSGLRYGFAQYITHFPTYETLYGALATVPIFLVWMYVSWVVGLIGAVVAAALPSWRRGLAAAGSARAAGDGLVLALEILAALYGAIRAGRGIKRRLLIGRINASEAGVDAMLAQLRTAGYADVTSEGHWLPSRDPDTATLYDLYRALGLGFDIGAPAAEEDVPAWRRRLDTVAYATVDSEAELMGMTLRDLLAEEKDEGKTEGAEPLPLRRSP